MEFVKGLGELGPTALMVVALFIMAKYVILPILKTQRESAEQYKQALDGNTSAVRESVKHNERIIANHLSKEEKRDKVILAEMRGVAEAIEGMNNRRRADN